MGHALDDLAKHNAWATANVLSFCQTADASILESTMPGTYGSVIQILRHIIDSEMSYLFRLTGLWPERPWQADEAVGLDILTERATQLAATWDRFLESDIDTERLGEARGDDGTIFAVPAGVFITQAFHHANEHRAHICSILGSAGLDTPNVSAWEYSFVTGRSTVKTPAPE